MARARTDTGSFCVVGDDCRNFLGLEIVRHSQSKTIELALSEKSGLLRMEIRDSGVGFAVTDARMGLGLSAMRERLGSVGGRLTVKSDSGAGTLVVAEAPLPLREVSNDTPVNAS